MNGCRFLLFLCQYSISWIECLTSNQKVGKSNPPRRAPNLKLPVLSKHGQLLASDALIIKLNTWFRGAIIIQRRKCLMCHRHRCIFSDSGSHVAKVGGAPGIEKTHGREAR